ncbi:MAG: hypothetical protein RIB93_21950 [Coleofasciculus sp. D1-CHI-01]|uniref:hypothetical protein n=1 Tax=Coleofasciculus sp. D1-CHI-01 TaxID=3068482 RepID=UPI0032F70944
MAKYKIKYQALQRDCFDSKGKKGMSKIITDRRNSLIVATESCRYQVIGYPDRAIYAASRRRYRIKGSRGTIVSGKTSQLIAAQSLNPSKEQTITSDSLTMRAIQAFMDTEDEWAEVYANLAKS